MESPYCSSPQQLKGVIARFFPPFFCLSSGLRRDKIVLLSEGPVFYNSVSVLPKCKSFPLPPQRSLDQLSGVSTPLSIFADTNGELTNFSRTLHDSIRRIRRFPPTPHQVFLTPWLTRAATRLFPPTVPFAANRSRLQNVCGF